MDLNDLNLQETVEIQGCKACLTYMNECVDMRDFT